MLDFFDYSGVKVLNAKRFMSLAEPVSYGFKNRSDEDSKQTYEKMLLGSGSDFEGAKKNLKKVNMFAVSKMGSSNMIFPQTLDVQVKNY